MEDLSTEQKTKLKDRVSIEPIWKSKTQIGLDNLRLAVDKFVAESSESRKLFDKQVTKVSGWQEHYDNSFEDVISNTVKIYLQKKGDDVEPLALYKNSIFGKNNEVQCEIDGLLQRADGTFIFIEAKMNLTQTSFRNARTTFESFKDYIGGVKDVDTTKLDSRSVYCRQVKDFQNLITNENIKIEKYLGANNWIKLKEFDSRQVASDDHWSIVERNGDEFTVKAAEPV